VCVEQRRARRAALLRAPRQPARATNRRRRRHRHALLAVIKKEFDKKHGPTWHAIVGRSFGSYVTHETKHFIYFYLGQVAILLFKSG